MAVPFRQETFLEEGRQIVEKLVIPGIPDSQSASFGIPLGEPAQVFQFVFEEAETGHESFGRGCCCIRR